jgi:hypothetical protein
MFPAESGDEQVYAPPAMIRATAVEAKNFNALEIVEITAKRFLGLNYVTVVAHPRHIKKSPFLRDLNTYYVARNLWNAKGIWRRRSQIGSMRKGI